MEDCKNLSSRSKKIDFSNFSSGPGVYKMLDENGCVIYIGKAKNIRSRLSSYKRLLSKNSIDIHDSYSVKLLKLMEQVHSIKSIETETETEAILLEASLIQKIKPFYNILFKDDKSFPYIEITDHKFPRIRIIRSRNKFTSKNHFGPFLSTRSAKHIIDILQKSFLIRNCTDPDFKSREKPCLLHQLSQCSAPCKSDNISESEYQKNIKDAIRVLNGKNANVIEELEQSMIDASRKEYYELAAIYRDRIKSLSQIKIPQKVHFPDVEKDTDVFVLEERNGINAISTFSIRRSEQVFHLESRFEEILISEEIDNCIESFIIQFYSKNPIPENIIVSNSISDATQDALKSISSRENNSIRTLIYVAPKSGVRKDLIKIGSQRALETIEKNDNFFQDLSDFLDLKLIPESIEIYDNSHIMGQNAVGSFVSLNQNGIKRIKHFELSKKDDYSMMKECLEHRIEYRKNLPLSSLIIVDGGAGHAKVVDSMLKAKGFNISVFGLAKGKDRKRDTIYDVRGNALPLPHSSYWSKQLMNLRDTAHNKAIAEYRKLHKKSML